MTRQPSQPEERDPRGFLLPVLLIVFLAALDLTVVAPILPVVISELGINPVDADRYAWIVLAYLVAYTVTVPVTGRLSDYAGRVPVFSAAMLLFLIGSVVVATTDTLQGMILGRSLQGLGGGAMLPVSMALVADRVPIHRRAMTLGLVAAVDTFGWVLGPVWGAAISELLGSWRAIFWLNLPLGAAAAIVLFQMRAHTMGRQVHVSPPWLSIGMGSLALVTFCLALSSGGEAGFGAGQGAARLGGETNPLATYRWPLLGLSLVLFSVFIALERRAANPLLPHTLLRDRVFQVAGIANILVGGALIIAMVNAPLVVALLAESAAVSLDTALLLGAFTLAMTVGAIMGGRGVNLLTPRITAVAGLAVAAVGFLVMRTWPNELQLLTMATTMAIAGMGLGVVVAPIGEVAIRVSHARDYGAASGLVLLARLMGMTLGLSAITAFGLQRLDAKVQALPTLSPEPGETTAAFFARQQTFLNEQVIPMTLEIIRETFLIAALVCLLALIVAARLREAGRIPD